MLGRQHDAVDAMILLGRVDLDPLASDTLGGMFNGYAPSPVNFSRPENVQGYISGLLVELTKQMLARHDLFFGQTLPVAEYPLVAGFDTAESPLGFKPVRVSVGSYPEALSKKVRFPVHAPNELRRFNRIELMMWATAQTQVMVGYTTSAGESVDVGEVGLRTTSSTVGVDLPAGLTETVSEVFIRPMVVPQAPLFLLVERVSFRFSPAPLAAPLFPVNVGG